MYSNLFLDMHAFNLIGAPSCMLMYFVEKISSCPGHTVVSNHVHMKIKNYPKDIGLLKHFDVSGNNVSSIHCVGRNRKKCESLSLLNNPVKEAFSFCLLELFLGKNPTVFPFRSPFAHSTSTIVDVVMLSINGSLSYSTKN